ncbi:hypothetical protein ACIGW3_10785 [Streptomyces sp. NPDC053499]|uniref:YunG family protein n=1 Tax=Streptomyces sp. NPDC053499 TaxID=3365707 RepID=UPI0037D03B6F
MSVDAVGVSGVGVGASELDRIEGALRASWGADTCAPDDLERAGWSPANPAWGQCDVTALVVHDLLGGELMCGEVYAESGGRQGFHWWNRLPDGSEIDLTRDQFRAGQVVMEGVSVPRPMGHSLRRAAEYTLLRTRVWERLGLPAGGATAGTAQGACGSGPRGASAVRGSAAPCRGWRGAG